jgi:predicted amidohydrolase
MYDEYTDMDHIQYCKEVAITIPGEETDRLAEKAKKYGVYIVAQAKALDPDIMPDRFFNTGFIISPSGEIVLKHVKNVIHTIEGSTSPYDVWDAWVARKGDGLEGCYPVLDSDIGKIGIAICAESYFCETYRAFVLRGADLIVTMAYPEPIVSRGWWEVRNRYIAMYNSLYLVCTNFGPYYTTPDSPSPYTLSGGNSMIVNYRGEVLCHAKHPSEAYVSAEIDIMALRDYRSRSGMSFPFLAQMRSSLWKKIYEQWPEWPKNLYVQKPAQLAERFESASKAAKKLEG